MVSLAAAPHPLVAVAGETDLSGSIDLEWRLFNEDPAYPGQEGNSQGSLVLRPVWEWESEDRKRQVRFAPFFRLDERDDERTHFDLREGYIQWIFDEWELLAGVNKVFWGVTESRHLVDVINQVDFVEDIDEEDRLGQPMILAATQRSWGRVEAFLLPGFRERTFPGSDGRLRFPLTLDTDNPLYTSGAEDRRIDGALRWSHYFGDWDVGVSWFHGTGREPRFVPVAAAGDPNTFVALRPAYDVIHQLGVDVQYTREAWLWKLETIGRQGQGRDFAAAVAGFEYTFYQLGGGASDLGVLLEYLWDDRDLVAPFTVSEDDYFVGARWARNDTQDTSVLGGVIVDAGDGSIAGLLEFQRRLGERFKIEAEARWFSSVDPENPLTFFEQDSFLTLRFARYF